VNNAKEIISNRDAAAPKTEKHWELV